MGSAPRRRNLIRDLAEQSRGLPFGSQDIPAADRDLVYLRPPRGDEHRITKVAGGHADRSRPECPGTVRGYQ